MRAISLQRFTRQPVYATTGLRSKMSAAAGDSSAAAAAIIDDADFERMRGEMAAEDEKREVLIKRSREALKASKNSIYDLHRGSIDRAKAALATAKELIKTELLPLTVATPALRFSLSGALEEYAESFIFACYLTEKRIPAFAELEICSREVRCAPRDDDGCRPRRRRRPTFPW